MNGTQRALEQRERKREDAHGGDDRGKRERARAEHLPHHDADDGRCVARVTAHAFLAVRRRLGRHRGFANWPGICDRAGHVRAGAQG